MLRVLILFLVHLLLWGIFATLNHAVAPWQLYLYTGGLFITYAGLKLDARTGLAVALLSGCLFDAGAPVTFGQQAITHALGFLWLYRMRNRIAHDIPVIQASVAVLANSALYLALFVIHFHHLNSFATIWPRFLWEMLFSSLLVGLVAPWVMALQSEALRLITPPGFRHEEEE